MSILLILSRFEYLDNYILTFNKQFFDNCKKGFISCKNNPQVQYLPHMLQQFQDELVGCAISENQAADTEVHIFDIYNHDYQFPCAGLDNASYQTKSDILYIDDFQLQFHQDDIFPRKQIKSINKILSLLIALKRAQECMITVYSNI